MKKIFNYIKSLFMAPSLLKALENKIDSLVKSNNYLQSRVDSLEAENKRLNNNYLVHERQLDLFGALLNVGVDVHVKYQDSIAFVSYKGKNGMEGKIFELDREGGAGKIFRFLEDLHVPSKNVFFDEPTQGRMRHEYRRRRGE